jgi:hypothetical protein
MDSIVPHLNGWAEVTFQPWNLPTFLLSMHPDLCHLFLRIADHHSKPTW